MYLGFFPWRNCNPPPPITSTLESLGWGFRWKKYQKRSKWGSIPKKASQRWTKIAMWRMKWAILIYVWPYEGSVWSISDQPLFSLLFQFFLSRKKFQRKIFSREKRKNLMRKSLKQKKFQNNSKKIEETFCIQIWIKEVCENFQEKYFEEI